MPRSFAWEVSVRNWLSEVRIGLIAGVSAGAMILVAPKIATMWQPSHGDSVPSTAAWSPPLVDPIQAASAALARGDSTFLAVALNDSLQFPGLTQAVSQGAAQESMRMYSPASTGLKGARWEAFVPRVVPYAAAYNAVVQAARVTARSRS